MSFSTKFTRASCQAEVEPEYHYAPMPAAVFLNLRKSRRFLYYSERCRLPNLVCPDEHYQSLQFDEDMLKGTFLLEETQDNLIDVSGADKIEVG